MYKKNDIRRRLLAGLVVGALLAPCARAQKAALKTNLFYDATATVSAGLEAGLAPRWTLDLSANYNGWTVGRGGKRWKHWLAQPEFRWWFCDRFAGHFLGMHLLGGEYNWGGWKGANVLGSDLRRLEDGRYEGWFAGFGAAYGYSWTLNRHWSMETEAGIGYAYTEFDKYRVCDTCGAKEGPRRRHNYVGPTRLALSLVYVF